MKHAGSREDLLSRTSPGTAENPLPFAFPGAEGGQSRVSQAVSFACGLLLVAIIADAPVRSLARSLDPSSVAVLHIITEFGNSAWPLGIGLMLLVSIAALSRRSAEFASDAVQALRSALLLTVGSVAISGVLASVAKNVIGRIRPSTIPDAEVFEFAVMSVRAGWASFPSGHATTATACALSLAICFPRQSWAWLSVGFLAAVSRAFLGVHWLSDCLAGLVLGAVVTLALRKRMQQGGHKLEVAPSVLSGVIAAAAVAVFKSMILNFGRVLDLAKSGTRPFGSRDK